MKKYCVLYLLLLIASPRCDLLAQCTFNTLPEYGLMCEQAIHLCGNDLDGFSGRLNDDKSPTPQPNPVCGSNGEADNIKWFSFFADDPNIEILIQYSNCTDLNVTLGVGFQAGLYNSCELDSDGVPQGVIQCETNFGYADIVLMPDPLEIQVGNLYYFFLDGLGKAVCDYSIDVVSGICTEPLPAPDPCAPDCGVTNVFSDYKGCTEFTETYSFDPTDWILEDLLGCNPALPMAQIDSIICIEWEITPDTGFDMVSSSLYYDSLNITSEIDITWKQAGTYIIKPILNVNPQFSPCRSICECTDDIAYTIIVEESRIETLPLVELCPGECYDFCGITYCNDALETCHNRDSCTIYTQEIKANLIQFVDIGDYYICPGNCFIFNNVPYCTENIFSVPDLFACDTSYTFELIELDLDLFAIQADDTIDCNNTSVLLEADFTTNFTNGLSSFWLSETGDTVSFDNSYAASSEGTYTYYVVPDSLEGCATSLDFEVFLDDTSPSVLLTGPDLDCNLPMANIQLSSAANISSTAWTGPNGFISNDSSPIVSEPGMYEVLVTGTNGCTTTESIEVTANFEEPNLTVDFENFDCTDNIPSASFQSDSTIVSVAWEFPDSNISINDSIDLGLEGEYTLTVTATNGCTAEELFMVEDLAYDPSLNISEEYIWRCRDTMREVDISSLVMPDIEYNWYTLQGGFLSSSDLLSITEPAVYILVSEDADLGCIGSDTLRIIEDPDPFSGVEYNAMSPMCHDGEDGIFEILNHTGGEGPYMYSYEGNTYASIDDVDFGVGEHTLSIVDVFGCEVVVDFEIINPPKLEVSTDPSVTILYGNSEELVVDVNISEDSISSITWTDEDNMIIATGNNAEIDATEGSILVTVEDLNGCTATSQIELNIDYDIEIYYPSIFSPNGDGQNDIFSFYSNGFPETIDRVQIFDRIGELIYEARNQVFNDPTSGWDGSFNGRRLQPGVYVFSIRYMLGNGEMKNKFGSITLVR